METENFSIPILGKGKLAGSSYGTGDLMLICFHGYGQTRRLFQPLFLEIPVGWRVVMLDLPFFGESEWQNPDLPILPSDLDGFLKELLGRYPSKKIHFLAFSMGAKIALGLYQATNTTIQSITLISPDGLRIHPLYRFCIYNPIGKALFYKTLRWPSMFLSIIWLLYKLRIADPFKYKFLHRQFDSKEKRTLIRQVWRANSEIRPDLDAISMRSEVSETVWHIIWGEQDNILPLNLCKDFIHKVKGAKLHVVDGGHFLLNPPHKDVKLLLQMIWKA